MASNPSSKKKPSIIFLMGPTASGKTQLAFSLAEVLPVEIISVDSAQVYRGLDIGSAKPNAEELATVPHHLIDIRDPNQPYSAAEFRLDALKAIDDILSRNKTPLLVGGSMLYFNILLNGLAQMPAANESVRADIEKQAESLGWPAMHQKLAEVDPQSAARLHPNHSQRIARALEVYRVSGQSLSELHEQQQDSDQQTLDHQFQIHQWAIAPKQREVLHRRIGQRFDQMIGLGFEKEVAALRNRGDLNPDLPAIRSVGYRQMWAYLNGDYGDGESSFEEMLEKGKAATRQLAKRQFTWLRGWKNLNWLTTENEFGETANFEQIREQALNSFLQGPI